MILNHTDNLSIMYKMNHVPLPKGKMQRWKRLKHWNQLGMKIVIGTSWKLSRPIKTVLKLMSHLFQEKDGDQSALTITSNLQLITSLKVTSRYFVEFILKLSIMLFKQSKHVLIKQIGLLQEHPRGVFEQLERWAVSRKSWCCHGYILWRLKSGGTRGAAYNVEILPWWTNHWCKRACQVPSGSNSCTETPYPGSSNTCYC